MLFYPTFVRGLTDSKQYHRMQIYWAGWGTAMLRLLSSKEDYAQGQSEEVSAGRDQRNDSPDGGQSSTGWSHGN